MNAQDQVRQLIDKMKSAALAHPPRMAEVEGLTGDIETLVLAHSEPSCGGDFENVSLTKGELRIAEFLRSRMGRCVSRDSLLGAMCFDYHGREEPEPKIIDVLVLRIRRKLAKTEFRIVT